MSLPYVAEMKSGAASSRPASHRSPKVHVQSSGQTDSVFVDCFFYGFWLPKAKLPAFQASLRQQQAVGGH